MSQSFCAGASVSAFNLIGHQYALIESSSPLKFGQVRGHHSARYPQGGVLIRHSGNMAKKDRTEAVLRARSALIVAAMRRSIMTYTELGKALGLEGIQLRNEMRHILDDLSADCVARGERSLAALVVNQATGAPGQGWKDGEKPWHAEVQAVFRQWAS